MMTSKQFLLTLSLSLSLLVMQHWKFTNIPADHRKKVYSALLLTSLDIDTKNAPENWPSKIPQTHFYSFTAFSIYFHLYFFRSYYQFPLYLLWFFYIVAHPFIYPSKYVCSLSNLLNFSFTFSHFSSQQTLLCINPIKYSDSHLILFHSQLHIRPQFVVVNLFFFSFAMFMTYWQLSANLLPINLFQTSIYICMYSFL